MIEDHWAATTEKVPRRIELGTDRRDVFSPILEDNDHGKGLSQPEIQSNAWLFTNAGSETTAGLLSGTTYYLPKNPMIMDRITEEVRANLKMNLKSTHKVLRS